MKNHSVFATFGALALIAASSSTASAALLFGFHTFNNSGSSESASDGIFSSTSVVTKTLSSSSTGGSNDGFYGNSAIVAGGANTGHLNLSGSPTGFTITNNSAVNYTLESLYFDFTGEINSFFSVDVDYGDGANTLEFPTVNSAVPGANPDSNYLDGSLLFADYGEYSLLAGQTVSILFTGFQSGIVIDNIALTGVAEVSGVPEVANFAALGGLVISGLTIRSRRRSSSKN